MSDLVIEFESGEKDCDASTEKLLAKKSKRGLSWEWKYFTDLATTYRKGLEHFVYLSWTFNWNEKEMEERNIAGFVGDCTATYMNYVNDNSIKRPIRFSVLLTRSGQCIKRKMGPYTETEYRMNHRFFDMQLKLKSFKTHCVISKELKFFDAVLDVEGRKINVNKNYLSLRSEFFDKLFNSDFKEKSMDEIPIKDVKYRDFQLLLDIIHPTEPTLPNEEDFEMLLELADRFMIPAVTHQIESILMNYSTAPLSDILKLADKFKLEQLLEHSLSMLTTKNNNDVLIHFTDFTQLSDPTRLKLFDRVMTVFHSFKYPVFKQFE